jgi:hypothetical protein
MRPLHVRLALTDARRRARGEACALAEATSCCACQRELAWQVRGRANERVCASKGVRISVCAGVPCGVV